MPDVRHDRRVPPAVPCPAAGHLQIITAAEASGHARVAEMNRQVADNLGKIITALEADGQDQQQEAAASAS